MILQFTLSMPGCNSWNGKWSGESRIYAKTINFGKSLKRIEKAQFILANGSYFYDFGDGWRASISVKEIDAKESRKINRITNGFYGYDWMIDDIRSYGRILKLEERKQI